jgi:hypothetical protein
MCLFSLIEAQWPFHVLQQYFNFSQPGCLRCVCRRFHSCCHRNVRLCHIDTRSGEVSIHDLLDHTTVSHQTSFHWDIFDSALKFHAAVVHECIYCVLPKLDEEGGLDIAMWQFSSVTGQWLRKADSTQVPSLAAVAVIENLIFYCGGFDMHSEDRQATSTLLAFDTLSDQWLQLPDMQRDRVGHAVAVKGGRLYITGGRPQRVNQTILEHFITWNSVEVWDATVSSWLPCPHQNVERANHSATFLGDRLFAVGGSGHVGSEAEFVFHESVEVLCINDRLVEGWVAAGSLAEGREEHTTLVSKSGNLVVAGGTCDYGHLFDFWDIEVYESSSDAWTTILPTQLRRVCAFYSCIGDVLYISGGREFLEDDDWAATHPSRHTAACTSYQLTDRSLANVLDLSDTINPQHMCVTRFWRMSAE